MSNDNKLSLRLNLESCGHYSECIAYTFYGDVQYIPYVSITVRPTTFVLSRFRINGQNNFRIFRLFMVFSLDIDYTFVDDK